MPSSPELPRLIAVHGLKRAGKGTVAAHLALAYGYRQVKFAATLKDMVGVLLTCVCGLDAETAERCIEGDLKEIPLPALGGKSTRYLMQVVGTEWRDTVATDLWLRIAVREIREIIAAGGRAVLDDLRFPHELVALRAERAALWLVTSARAAGAGAVPQIPWDTHAAVTLAFEGHVLPAMLRALLGRCITEGPDAVERAVSGDRHATPLAVLGGHSAAHCLATLSSVLVPLIAKPWTPAPAAADGHVSEKGLPPEEFALRLHNDGTREDLYAAVDGSLRGLATLAA